LFNIKEILFEFLQNAAMQNQYLTPYDEEVNVL